MSATSAVLRTEARLFSREPGFVFWIVGFPTALLVVLGFVPPFREANADQGGRSVLELYVQITVLLAMITAGVMAMPATLSAYREQGVLRRLRTTPVGPGSVLAAQVVLHSVAALGSAVLVLAVARVAYGIALPEHLLGYALGMLLALAASLSLGAFVTAFSPTSKVANALASIGFFVSMFTAGVWIPVQAMPDLLRELVSLTPMGAASEALDRAATGSLPDVVHLVVVAGWAVLLGAAAVRTFRWE
jgi:ABC-2 type transport system permease protein